MYKSFREMSEWQKAMEFSVQVFNFSSSLPRSEDYGLTSQLRRAANSISANMAEGFGRNTNKDKSNFYLYSHVSAFETQSHLIYGLEVGYFENNKVEQLVSNYNELIHELNRILKSLEK